MGRWVPLGVGDARVYESGGVPCRVVVATRGFDEAAVRDALEGAFGVWTARIKWDVLDGERVGFVALHATAPTHVVTVAAPDGAVRRLALRLEGHVGIAYTRAEWDAGEVGGWDVHVRWVCRRPRGAGRVLGVATAAAVQRAARIDAAMAEARDLGSDRWEA